MVGRNALLAPAARRVNRRELGAALALTLIAAIDLTSPASFVTRSFAQTPERIVAAGGVITEVLYALGLQDRLVGVDSTSQFPAEALKDKPNIGYVRALSAEGVLSLKPSLVMAITSAGPPDAISLLNEAGVRLARIPDDMSADGVVTKIEAIGAVAGAVEPARRLAAQTKARFDELATLRTALPAKRRVLFVLSLQNGRTMVGGRNSSADAIIDLAGGINAAAAVEGYKPMTDEAIIAAAPDAILMMRNSGNHDTATEALFALPAFSQTPAAAQRAHIVMDGLYLLGFGPRTPAAARDLMAALYPNVAIPPLKTAAAP
ncbi:hemin ABC transporter substrate-binding protein [Bosea sp. 685]|uniref:heme/hemin ABC transporter substrate-binding protein n=1 Tax=Bosea sp. 685 TaxID=3080057 RepID=UPI002892A9C2|nr:ABC transporter substrate-binding protein [Bosea sp. 685]WNJ91137.1 ABC transporter substrate-binding protein [Bosea sp. 685]